MEITTKSAYMHIKTIGLGNSIDRNMLTLIFSSASQNYNYCSQVLSYLNSR